jgi:hypothetical protein
MVRKFTTCLGFLALAAAFTFQTPLRAQDPMKHDQMQDDKMMHEGQAKTLFTGKFYGKVHTTSGRATVYQEIPLVPALQLA